MPGRGLVEDRPFNDAEREALAAAAKERGIARKEILRLLGGSTCDVFLNDGVFWRNVPRAAWEYRIGGYQVFKKWLSYRESDILGRPLSRDEFHEATAIVRRLVALILRGPDLDDNYSRIKAEAFDWSTVSGDEVASE